MSISAQHLVTMQILVVENEERTSERKGTKYQHFAARMVLLDEAGRPVTVGTLRSRRVKKELLDSVKPGYFRAGFTLEVPDWGDDKGDLVSVVSSLTPLTAAQVSGSPAAAPAAAPSK